MIRGRVQGQLDTAILLGIDHGPEAEATRLDLTESAIRGLRLLGRDLCHVHQWTADRGAQAPLVGLLAGRGLFLSASEVAQPAHDFVTIYSSLL